MPRIAIIDRADMNAEQARIYDVAKQTTGIVGGPYHAYIRLPKVFEACQTMRATLGWSPGAAWTGRTSYRNVRAGYSVDIQSVEQP